MAYKFLGYVIWRAGKWYARRKLQGSRRKVAVAAVSATAIASVIVAARSGAGDQQS